MIYTNINQVCVCLYPMLFIYGKFVQFVYSKSKKKKYNNNNPKSIMQCNTLSKVYIL